MQEGCTKKETFEKENKVYNNKHNGCNQETGDRDVAMTQYECEVKLINTLFNARNRYLGRSRNWKTNGFKMFLFIFGHGPLLNLDTKSFYKIPTDHVDFSRYEFPVMKPDEREHNVSKLSRSVLRCGK